MKVKFFKFFSLTLVLCALYASAAFASGGVVDLKFTIGSTTYTSNGITRHLNASPFLSSGTTLVPLRAIMDELGFQTTWYENTRAISCRQGDNAVSLKIGSREAILNGTTYNLDTMPVIVNDITFVPLRFISESSGASVVWDNNSKNILISRIGSLNTGSVFFYNSSGYYFYDGNTLFHNNLPKGDSLNSAYIFGEHVFMSQNDSSTGTDNLVMLKNGSFVDVRSNFQVLQTIKFNNYLLVNGLNETTNTYELLQFNGSTFNTIASDFLIKKYVVYNGKLIMNKYDNNRNYSLYSYDGNSLTQIYSGYVVTDFAILDDNRLYMIGSKMTDKQEYLSRYDSNYFTDVFTAGSQYNYNLPFKLSDLFYVPKSGQLYAYYNSALHQLNWSNVNETTFSLGGRTIALNISSIAKLNGSLVLNVNGINSVKVIGSNGQLTTDSSYYDTAKSAFKGLMLFDSPYSYSMIYKNASFSKIDICGSKIVACGTDQNSISSQNNRILLIYDSAAPITYYNYANNINNPMIINNINSYDKATALNDDVIISINETDPATGKSNNSVIAYKTIYNGYSKTYSVINLLTNFRTDKFEKVGGVIYISGSDDLGRNCLYEYNGIITTVKLNSRPQFWQSYEDITFASFNNYDTNHSDFVVYINGIAKPVSQNLRVYGVTKLNNNYYLVDAQDENSSSLYSGRNVYIYNPSSNTLSLMQAGFTISKTIVEN